MNKYTIQQVRKFLYRKGFVNVHRMMNEEFSKPHRRKTFHKTLSEKEYKRRLKRDTINHKKFISNFDNHKNLNE